MPRLSRLLGYVALIAMSPVAIIGIVGTANEYRAIGVDAIDCDGPASVLIFAVPALMVYAAATFIFLKRRGRRRVLVLGALCGLISLGLIWNIGNAATEQWRNDKQHVCRTEI